MVRRPFTQFGSIAGKGDYLMGRRCIEVDEQRVKEYHASGKSQNWIALRFCVSKTVIQRVLIGKKRITNADENKHD